MFPGKLILELCGTSHPPRITLNNQ